VEPVTDENQQSGQALPPPPPEQGQITVPTGGAVSLKPAEFFPDAKLFEGSTVHPNTAQNIIITTEDKVRNYLHEYARAGGTRTEWRAPLGITIAISTAFLTAKFNDALGISSAYWEALFSLGLFGAIVWLISSLIRLVMFWKRGSVDTLIKKIKKLESE
jgi:hypothetical protein